ncbi:MULTISPECIES: hypothetical protein [Pseudoalteromonas]|uniref:Uncharacterized protein n=1 Tax=Pseudoalteromonas piscicida TaxID=43662 RepID=A0A2A5JJ94_PSEO7|nr:MULTISPECIES: hypothetical protein [Pseudoalteromonas]PCK29533.1 hypothetical protein CEX98_22660 [Pseudoalteromonas piscicida]TMN39059.1 hypothetical protein CWC03_10220 [Pseudoalteromonas sp. S2755]
MKSNNVALQHIASYLNAHGCKTLDEVDGALQLLIETAKVTQSQYRNGTAEKATSVPSIN